MSARLPSPNRVPIAIAADHPAFAGHFPGRPVVPAVVLLAEALAEISRATARPMQSWTVVSAKFLAPVGPGIDLTMSHSGTATGGHRFEIRAGEDIVASGTLAPRQAP